MRTLDEPIHYKELTEAIIEYKLWIPYGKNPDQIVYSAMHQDVKKRGDYSAFRFMGKGIFIFSDVSGVSHVEMPKIRRNDSPKDQLKRPGEMPHDTVARLAIATEKQRCGNCSNIEFEGAEAYRQRRGTCSQYENSDRASVNVSAEPCQFWRQRTVAQRNTDQSTRKNLHIFMSGLPYLLPRGERRAK